MAWINGLMHVIIKEDLYDKEFIENRTVGFDDLKRRSEKYTPEYVEAITGIPANRFIETARVYALQAAGCIYLYCHGNYPAHNRNG